MTQGAVDGSAEESLDKLVSLNILHLCLSDVHGSPPASESRGILRKTLLPLWSQHRHVFLPCDHAAVREGGREGGRERETRKGGGEREEDRKEGGEGGIGTHCLNSPEL